MLANQQSLTKAVTTAVTNGAKVSGATLAAIAALLSPAQAGPIDSLDLIGQQAPTGFAQLSGITYGGGNTYYAISDDTTPGFYTVSISFSGTSLGSVASGGKTNLTNVTDYLGAPLSGNQVDAEGIALTSGGKLYISSEGSATANPDAGIQNANPIINRFDLATGAQEATVTLANRYTIAGSTTTTGVRSNLIFESLTLTPDQSRLFSALETPLKQDQSLIALGLGASPLLRLLQFNASGGNYTAGAEYLYTATPGYGLSDLLAIDNTTLVALERNFQNLAINLFEVSLGNSPTDISSNNALGGSSAGITAVQKRLIPIAGSLTTANYEGLTFGPTLADGRRSLILVADNGAGEGTATNFAAFAVNASGATPVPFEFSPALGLLLLGGSVATQQLRQHLSRTNDSQQK